MVTRKHASSDIDAARKYITIFKQRRYAKLSLKPEEALVLLRFLDNIKTTRKDWHKLDAIHSKLNKAYQKI